MCMYLIITKKKKSQNIFLDPRIMHGSCSYFEELMNIYEF